MKTYRDIFAEDIEVPTLVQQKAEDAFAQIRMEGNKTMIDERNSEYKRKIRLFRKPAVLVACICIFALASITSAAAIQHFWSRGARGTIQATDQQQQNLTDQGVAVVLQETENEQGLSVTDGTITVTPETVIADDMFAHISFSVSGYSIGDNEEPCFEFVDTYLGDDPMSEDSWVNMSASFYGGLVCDENGSLVYDDGTPPEFGENGELISRYVDENGNMEYVVSISAAEPSGSLLGKTLHVNLKNIGTVYKAEYKNAAEGTWNFTIPLPDTSAAVELPVQRAVDGTNFVIDTIELSPISIKINYTVQGQVKIHDDENGVPRFCGVVLKDGTRLPYLGNGGSTGYSDTAMGTAYAMETFSRVIEPEQVAAVLVQCQTGTDMVEIPISE